MPETLFGMKGEQKFRDDRHPVMNETGSSKDPKCSCGSWLEHFKVYSRTARVRCVYLGCTADAVDGSHVQLAKKVKGNWTPHGESWIVPMCTTHNRSRHTNPFFIDKNCPLIDPSVRDECKTAVYAKNRNNYFEMRVARATTPPKCGCVTYYDHYRLLANSNRIQCAAVNCNQRAVGAVKLRSVDGRRDRDLWIAPLCLSHSKSRDEFFIKRIAPVVSPRRQSGCGASGGPSAT